MRYLVVCFVMSLLGLSASSQTRSAKALTTQIRNGVFTAELSQGYHFNEKAPNGLQAGDQWSPPSSIEKNKLVITHPSQWPKGSFAQIYVCDDAVTFCETHKIFMNGPSSDSLKKKVAPKSLTLKKDKHGFLVDQFEEALKIATKNQKLLFVDFNARWCPSCLRLENEIFSSKKFAHLARNFVLLKIDGDVFTNSAILEKYSVSGYPTLMFLTSDGQEIFRFYDYQPLETIEKIIREVNQYPLSITQLEALPRTEEIKATLWKRYFYADQFAKALEVMKTMKEKPNEFLSAQVQQAKTEEKSNYIQTLKEALALEPDSTRSLNWRMSLIESLDENDESRKVLAQESFTLTKKWLSDPTTLNKALATDSLGEYTGFERFYVTLLNAEIAETTKIESEAAWALVIQEGEKANIGPSHPGAALRFLSALIQSKDFKKSLVLVNQLLKKSPESGDLQRRKLRVLVELKNYEEAIVIGEKALKNSYGSNEFFVVEPLFKAYKGAHKKEKAKSLLDTYLTRNEINFEKMRTFKKKLEALKSEI